MKLPTFEFEPKFFIYSLKDILDYLSIYHYIAFGLIFLLFFLLMILAIALHRRHFLSLLCVMFAFGLITAGIGVAYAYIDEMVRGTELKDVKAHRLEYIKDIIVTGEIDNLSKAVIKKCVIGSVIVRSDTNEIKNFIYMFKPLFKDTMTLDEVIDINDSRSFRMVLDVSKVKTSAPSDIYVFYQCY